MKNKKNQKKEEAKSSEFKRKLEDEQDVSKEQSTPAGTGLSMILDEIFDQGVPFDVGFEGKPIEELIELGMQISSTKPIRIVTDWTYFDIRVTEKIIKRYAEAGLQPVMLMAHEILYDSSQPESVGNWVRTSLLKKFHPPGIFETRNRVYVMVNRGWRKSVTLDFIDSIH